MFFLFYGTDYFVPLVISQLIFHQINKGGKFLKKLWCCVCGRVWQGTNVAPFSAHNAHTTHNSFIRSDEGLALETSAFKLFTVANLRYKLSW